MSGEELPLIVFWERLLSEILDRTEKFPKKARFTFSTRIENLALDVIERLTEARYATGPRKAELLREVDLALARLRVILRISHDRRFISGFRIFPGLVRLDGHRANRLARRLRSLRRGMECGVIREEDAAASAGSAVGWAAQADTRGLLRSIVRENKRENQEAGRKRHGETGASNRVIRGGSFNNDAQNLRASNRNRNDPANRNNNLGFRPASSRHQPEGRGPRTSFPCTSHDHPPRARAVRVIPSGRTR